MIEFILVSITNNDLNLPSKNNPPRYSFKRSGLVEKEQATAKKKGIACIFNPMVYLLCSCCIICQQKFR